MADFIIDDSTTFTPSSPNHAKGLIPRDYGKHPVGFYKAAPPLNIPLIPRSEWVERIKEGNASQSFVSHIRRRSGPGGGPIPSLDQNGQGYCFPAWTMIRMGNGSEKPIEYVVAGDAVVTAEGNVKRVTHTMRRHVDEPLYSPVLRNHSKLRQPNLRATKEHPILTKRGYVKACDLKPSDILAFPKFGTAETSHTEQDEKYIWGELWAVSSEPFSGNVFNLEVEDDHSYVAEGVGVHNCWAYSCTMVTMLARAIMNQPYVRLSGHMIGCLVKDYQDEGGWCGLSLEFVEKNGVASVATWKEKSMSRANDTPEMRADALLHKATHSWADMAASVYDRNLTEDQAMTLLLTRCPIQGDFNWWSHSVCLMDPVLVNEAHAACDLGSLDLNNEKDAAQFAAAFGKRGINSWTDDWGDLGEFTLTGSKAHLDGGVCALVTTAS